MSPEVVTAIIAASASVLTLVGTLAAQYLGRRATSRDTDKTLTEQGKHLDKTLREQREQLDETLAEQRSRTLNERFATAAELLGHARPEVRVGAIYALEQVEKDSLQLRGPIHELLSAYIRARSTWAHHDPATHAAIEAGRTNALDELPLLRIRAPDVQAAVTVLGRRCVIPGEVIELQSVDLRAAWLGNANLHGAILGRSMLAGADLSRADLSDALLRRVNFQGAILKGANLAGADLMAADLQRATCDGTTIWPEGFDWRAAGVAYEADPPGEA
jgi:Pentapeptide repeats (8 copies)